MSVREWLQANLKDGCDAGPVFAWAAAQGKARNTVLIQARNVGFKLVDGKFIHVGDKPPAQPRAARTERVNGAREHNSNVPKSETASDAESANADAAVDGMHAAGNRKGFDYDLVQEVERTNAEWREIAATAICRTLVEGDLLLFRNSPKGAVMFAEVWDVSRAVPARTRKRGGEQRT